jgi:creatinine amidohydrolase
VAILPVGAMEDHGPHLPLDTGNLIVSRNASALVQVIPEEVFVLPLVPFRFNEHHKDFPGVIYIQPETLLRFVLDVPRSLTRYGFRRILLLNGHGSNHPVLDWPPGKPSSKPNASVFRHPAGTSFKIQSERSAVRP